MFMLRRPARVRGRMREAGELGEDVAVKVERGERAFAAGDLVMFFRNERCLGGKERIAGHPAQRLALEHGGHPKGRNAAKESARSCAPQARLLAGCMMNRTYGGGRQRKTKPGVSRQNRSGRIIRLAFCRCQSFGVTPCPWRLRTAAARSCSTHRADWRSLAIMPP